LKKQAFCSQEVEEKKKIKIMKKERAFRMKIEVYAKYQRKKRFGSEEDRRKKFCFRDLERIR
jgi:hypothetical protein